MEQSAPAKERTPFWPDKCEHLKPNCASSGVFVGSTVSPNGEKWDVYIWNGEPWTKHREVCIRYGAEGYQYICCYDTPEQWSNTHRLVNYKDKLVLASEFDGSAMELVRAYLEKEKELGAQT